MIKALIFTFFAIFLGINGSGDSESPEKIDFISTRLTISGIIDKYDQSAYKSFYSLEELRPYSILKVDRISEMYENKWIEPESIVDLLTKKDKENLVKGLIEYINEHHSGTKTRLINKIKNWCIADRQFDLLTSTMEFTTYELLDAVISIGKTKKVFFRMNSKGEPAVERYNFTERNQVLSSAKNTLSGMSKREQLLYFSELYKILSEKVK